MYHLTITTRVPGSGPIMERIAVDSKETFRKKVNKIRSGYKDAELSTSELVDHILGGEIATLEVVLYLTVGENRYKDIENYAFVMTNTMVEDLRN